MNKIIIPPEIYRKLVSHAEHEKPAEACGILSGLGDKVRKYYPMKNRDKSSVSYFMEPEEQFKVVKEIRKNNREMLAIFHSHPETPARPSVEDIGKAFYPDCVYLILSLKGGGKQIKGFTVMEQKKIKLVKVIIN